MTNLSTIRKTVLLFHLFLGLLPSYIFSQTLRLESANVPYESKLRIPIYVDMVSAYHSIDAKDELLGTTWIMDYFIPVQQNIRRIGTLLFENVNFSSSSLDNSSFRLYCIVKGETTSGGIRSIGTKVTTDIRIKWIFAHKNDTLLVLEDIQGSGTTPIGNLFGGKANAKERMEMAIQNAFITSFDTLHTYILKILNLKESNPNVRLKDLGLNICINRNNNIFGVDTSLLIENYHPDEVLQRYIAIYSDSPLAIPIAQKLENNHILDNEYSAILNVLRKFNCDEPKCKEYIIDRLHYYGGLQKIFLENKLLSYSIGVTTNQEFINSKWNCLDPLFGVEGIIGFHKAGNRIEYEIGTAEADKDSYFSIFNIKDLRSFYQIIDEYYREEILNINETKNRQFILESISSPIKKGNLEKYYEFTRVYTTNHELSPGDGKSIQTNTGEKTSIKVYKLKIQKSYRLIFENEKLISLENLD